MSNIVKYFHSGMTGAPVLSGTAGALLGVLDACLVNGFGLKTVDSLVVSGGIATMNIASGHSFEVDSVALVAGATPAGLNGEKKILSVGTTFATFDATGISNQTATGTITTKLAPLDFAKPFSGTNLAVYRSANVASTRMFLRVSDTGTLTARVIGYESMTDVNTGVGPFPTESQVAGGRWWLKSAVANATARFWTLIGDDKTFCLHVFSGTSTIDIGGYIHNFGDFVSERSGDPYACMLTGATSDITGQTAGQTTCFAYTTLAGGINGNLPRGYTFLGGSVQGFNRAESLFTATGISGTQDNGVVGFPSPVNNGLYLTPMLVLEGSATFRGRSRGGYLCPQLISPFFDNRQKIDGRGNLLGRKLMAIKCCGPAGSKTQAGTMFFDITGPWI